MSMSSERGKSYSGNIEEGDTPSLARSKIYRNFLHGKITYKKMSCELEEHPDRSHGSMPVQRTEQSPRL